MFWRWSLSGIGIAAALLSAGALLSGTESTAVAGSRAAAHVLYVSKTGSDRNPGTRARPLRSIAAAWATVPSGTQSGVWTIRIAPGDYRSGMPVYWENKHGRILLEGTSSRQRPLLGSMNVFQVTGLTLRNVSLRGGGDTFHCEQCQRVTLDRVRVRGVQAQETLKFNQSADITVSRSDISGAGDNNFDAVAVQRLRILNNHFHDAVDWCGYAKGGSTDVIVSGNLFTQCGTGGFTVGQGTGFQFMSWPFVHYEASAVLVANNSVRDTAGAAFGVQGGFNVLVRDNVATRVGSRSHVLEVTYGLRSCDGQPGDDGRSRCNDYLDRGGWGTTRVDDGTNAVAIPNRHVYLYNNVIVNPDGHASQWQVFQVPGAPDHANQAGSNVPVDTRADTDLRIAGNVIWDGGPGHELGLGDSGCRDGSSCAPDLVRSQNTINARRATVRNTATAVRPTGWVAVRSRVAVPPLSREGLPDGETLAWTSWPVP